MTLQQIISFISVAETKNYTYSAKQLYVTQPTLSNQIKTLEKELGYVLFRRTNNGIELTEAGETFLTEARYMISHYEKAKKKLYLADKLKTEVLRIGYFANHELNSVLPILTKLKEKYPHLQLDLKVDARTNLLYALKDKELDMVVTYSIDKEMISGLSFHRLFSCESGEHMMMLAVPKNHPLSKKKSCSLENLKEDDVLWIDAGLDLDTFDVQKKLGMTETSVAIKECFSIQDALAICKAGFGVTLIPDYAIVEDPSLCYIPLMKMPEAEFGFYYNENPEGLLKELIDLFE